MFRIAITLLALLISLNASGSRLTLNSLPAERARGLVFSETFRSAQDVVANGGTITGSPSFNQQGATFASGERINYGTGGFRIRDGEQLTQLTMIWHGKITNTASQYNVLIGNFSGTVIWANVRFGLLYHSGVNSVYAAISDSTNTAEGRCSFNVDLEDGKYHTIAGVYDAPNLFLYVDGVVRVVRVVSVDGVNYTEFNTINAFGYNWGGNFVGSVAWAKVIRGALSAQEILDYSNNATFTYHNKAVLDLPMGLAEHDSTNNQTLDVSGNGNHAAFGDGVTGSTFPTKLSGKHGYSTDGGDYLRTANIVDSLSTVTLTALVKFGDSLSQDIYTYEDTDNSPISALFFHTGTNIQFYSGGAAGSQAANFANSSVANSGVLHVAGTYDGTNAGIWVNGEQGIDAVSPAAPVANSTSVATGFARGNLATKMRSGGELRSVKMWDFALTEIQMLDLHINERYMINAN